MAVALLSQIAANAVKADLIAEYDASKVVNKRPDQVTPAWTGRYAGLDPAFASDEGDYLLQHWYEPGNLLNDSNYGSWTSPDVPGFSMTKGAGEYAIEFKIKPIGDLRSSGANYASPNLMLSWVDDVDWYMISIDKYSYDAGAGTLGRITRGRFTMITLIGNIDWSVPHVIGIAYHGDEDQFDFYLDGQYKVSTSSDDVRNDAAWPSYRDITFGDVTAGDYDADAQWYYVRLYSAASDVGTPACGDPGTVYLDSDVNKDCRVDLLDWAIFAADWLECTIPGDPVCIQSAPAVPLTETVVFSSGYSGFPYVRIPALIVGQTGTLLAFCEGRHGGDGSETNMILRRSFDFGNTWQTVQTVLRGDHYGGGYNAIMNPCPVVDQSDGTIFLTCNYVVNSNPSQNKALVITSTDEGATWSLPVDITSSVGPVYTGPGVGIQLASGRLLIPSWDSGQSLAIYSDDHGASWQGGDYLETPAIEPQAVELIDGTVMMNIRSYRVQGCRAVATSNDGGSTWSGLYDDYTLVEPICQASILRYTRESDGFRKNRILFSNPDDPEDRVNMTVRLSYDEGATWPVSRAIYSGAVAYSCLAVLPDGTIGLLYEKWPLETNIAFARFSLDWLTEGEDWEMQF